MGANTISEALRKSDNYVYAHRFLSAPSTGLFFFVAKKKMRVEGVTFVSSVVSSETETLDVRVLRAASTTTLSASAGERAIASTIPADTAICTEVERGPASGQGSILHKGDKLFVMPSGACTGLAGHIQAELSPLE